ncbi:MAG: DMT family transporter [Coleofasciculaceae cyanobacterium]
MFLLGNYLSLWITDFRGELAALGAAFLWAASTVIYGRLGRNYPPLKLNLIKGGIAIALILLTLGLSGTRLPSLNIPAFGLLLLSGVIGIALGDTLYFTALNYLGARRVLLTETLAPPMTAVLAMIFLQESLTISAWLGIFLTLVGIAWVITEQVPGSIASPLLLTRGISFATLAALFQAGGAVLSRAALAETTISPLWGALLRLSAGTLILLLFTPFTRQRTGFFSKDLLTVQSLAALFFAAFAGTYLAIWLQQTALKFTAAGIAQTFLATSPLFVIPIATLMGETVSFRAILGVLVAIAGVALLLS